MQNLLFCFIIEIEHNLFQRKQKLVGIHSVLCLKKEAKTKGYFFLGYSMLLRTRWLFPPLLSLAILLPPLGGQNLLLFPGLSPDLMIEISETTDSDLPNTAAESVELNTTSTEFHDHSTVNTDALQDQVQQIEAVQTAEQVFGTWSRKRGDQYTQYTFEKDGDCQRHWYEDGRMETTDCVFQVRDQKISLTFDKASTSEWQQAELRYGKLVMEEMQLDGEVERLRFQPGGFENFDPLLISQAEQYFDFQVQAGSEFDLDELHQIQVGFFKDYESLQQQFAIQSLPKIQVSLYSNPEDYYRQFNVANVGGEIAGVTHFIDWDQPSAIALQIDEKREWLVDFYDIRYIAAHEMVHVLINERAGKWGSLYVPSWFHEGLAEHYSLGSIENDGRGYQTYYDYWFDLSEKIDLAPDLVELEVLHTGGIETAEEANVAYALSHVYVEYLIEQYGSDKVLSLLDDLNSLSDFYDDAEEQLGIDLYRDYEKFVNGL